MQSSSFKRNQYLANFVSGLWQVLGPLSGLGPHLPMHPRQSQQILSLYVVRDKTLGSLASRESFDFVRPRLYYHTIVSMVRVAVVVKESEGLSSPQGLSDLPSFQ